MTKSLKTSYDVDQQVESFFTGTQIAFDQTGEHFYCAYGSIINKVSVSDGQVKAQITTKNEGDNVVRFALASNDELLVIAYLSGLIIKFNLTDETIEREFKSIHSAPISFLKINPSNTLLATGSSDGTIKVWNLLNHYCSHNLKGVNGVISCIEFSESQDANLLYCSAGDDNIHIFDLNNSKRLAKLTTHCSTITDLKLNRDGTRLLSVGRDKISVLWNVNSEDKSKFGSAVRTIPIYESVESLVLLDPIIIKELTNIEQEDDRIFFATIGEEGILKFWDSLTGSRIFSQNEPPLSQDASPGTPCFYLGIRPNHNQLCTVSSERNIYFYDLPKLNIAQQLQGHLDEILSACWFAKDKYIAIACNSNDLKIVEVSTSKTRHLKGHQDIVLCVKGLASDPFCLISSSKDCTILIWKFDPDTMKANIAYRATGHTHSIYAIGSLYQGNTFFSGGEDLTIKKWSFADLTNSQLSMETKPLVANQTIKAHDDRIDDIAISPTDQLIATASRDKTSRIFTVDGMKILATLKGHKRGVHAVQFSPEDRVLITAADMNLRMWNLQDFTCIKTFQGHDCSVLNFTFLNSGLQVISVGSDGNLKLWDCKTNECMKTIDAHSGNTWVLAQNCNGDKLVTGGQDEKLIIWRDTTEEEHIERLTKLQDRVTQEQDFMNYINKKKWRKALKMALVMENPNKALSVLREIILEPDGVQELAKTLSKTNLNGLDFLIQCCVGWTASAKNCSVGQLVLNMLINQLGSEQLLRMPSFIEHMVQIENMTEKSFARYERLVQQSTFADFFMKSLRIQ